MYKELSKELRRRSIFWLYTLSVLTLVDEYIKEGYIFDINDVFNQSVTHEKVFIVLVAVATALVLSRGSRFPSAKTPTRKEVVFHRQTAKLMVLCGLMIEKLLNRNSASGRAYHYSSLQSRLN